MSSVLIRGFFFIQIFSFYREIDRLKKENELIRKQIADDQTKHSVTRTIQVQGKSSIEHYRNEVLL